MEQSATRADERHAQDSGRVAVPEIAELLHLQRPAAAVAAAVVVLVGLVVALVVPSVLPPTPLVGFGVGLVALLAAVVAAVILDGRDPVVRGPRHLRRDGHNVLARMAGPDPIEHGAAVLRALERRLGEREHLSVALTGTGTDASALAEAIGRGAAAAGHTSLVIDLRAAGAPGVSDVGAGTVRLGEAAELADDRPYAWIGAGPDRAAAVTAAAGVARRPPRDLELLLVVAPEAATHSPELLRACDRTVLLVAADTHQRAMVSARLEALARAGGSPEAVVVGGLHLGGPTAVTPARGDDRLGWAAKSAGAAGAATAAAAPAASTPPTSTASAPEAPAAPPAPEPPLPPVADDLDEPDEFDVEPEPDLVSSDDVDELDELAALVPEDEPVAADDEPTDDDAVAPSPPEPEAAADDLAGLDETGPIRPVAFRTAAADEPEPAAPQPPADGEDAAAPPVPPAPPAPDEAEEASELEGFAASDPLLTTAALEQLQERDGQG